MLAVRSTDSPAAIAHDLFRGSSFYPLRFLSCSFRDGVLTIGGRLPSFHLKQIAQTIVLGLEGVHTIDNRIEVTG